MEQPGIPAGQVARFDYDAFTADKTTVLSGALTQGVAKIGGITAWGKTDDALEGMLFTALNELRARRRGIVLPK
jgi:hypothetical protein